MRVKNVCKNRAITLPTGQRLVPGEEGMTPRTKPILDMVAGGCLEEVDPGPQMRTSTPIPTIRSPQDTSDDPGGEPVGSPPSTKRSPSGEEIAALHQKKTAKLARETIKKETRADVLRAWRDIEERKTVLIAIDNRLEELGG